MFRGGNVEEPVCRRSEFTRGRVFVKGHQIGQPIGSRRQHVRIEQQDADAVQPPQRLRLGHDHAPAGQAPKAQAKPSRARTGAFGIAASAAPAARPGCRVTSRDPAKDAAATASAWSA
ncbi:hypothetical protein [Streptomyces mirabilis]|uniref:hypothetical protein n=1 Tax=Streptomyces mirabilis TaxID=68239 RepID=UPI0036BEC167